MGHGLRNREHGFTLLELMIVVALIAIIAAVAIPNLLRSRMSANESAAVQGLRTISTGQAGFKEAAFVDADGDGAGDYGTLDQLSNPDGAGESPPFVDGALASGTKLGYLFTVAPVPGGGGLPSSYTALALPQAPGNTGWTQYFVDETGVIRFTGDGTAVSSDSAPLN